MKKANLQSLTLGSLMTNCYLMQNTQTREVLVVDPAASPERIREKIAQMGGRLTAILLTHGHYDHIGAVAALAATDPDIRVYACEKETPLLNNPDANLSNYFGDSCTAKADGLLRDLDTFEAAGFSMQMLYTPGHTPGSCCYYCAEEGILFSGDTLFAGSCGRTDFPGGSASQMSQSLHRLIGSLPDETEVYPGHNAFTTIGDEKRYNPFV